MSTPAGREPDEVQRFGRDVLRAALVDLTSKGLLYVGGSLIAGFVLLVVVGGSVPAWLLAVVALVAAIVLFFSRRQIKRVRSDLRTREARVTELEPFEANAPELEATVASFDWALERFEVYTAHVAEVLDHLQRVVSGDIEVPIPVYIERGILEPARNVLAPDEAVRLSVLLPHEDWFVMVWAAGHSLPGQQKYRVPIKDTLSRLAFESGELHVWEDAAEDDRFKQNPKATWPTRAMISIPLRRADEVVGVFNAIAAQPGAFDPAEERYLVSLGSIISVAVSVWLDQEGRT
jgi:hypothetical protein